MDYMAVVSWGAYPTPTPTNAQRAAFATSWGLLSVLGSITALAGRFFCSTSRFDKDPMNEFNSKNVII